MENKVNMYFLTRKKNQIIIFLSIILYAKNHAQIVSEKIYVLQIILSHQTYQITMSYNICMLKYIKVERRNIPHFSIIRR